MAEVVTISGRRVPLTIDPDGQCDYYLSITVNLAYNEELSGPVSVPSVTAPFIMDLTIPVVTAGSSHDRNETTEVQILNSQIGGIEHRNLNSDPTVDEDIVTAIASGGVRRRRYKLKSTTE